MSVSKSNYLGGYEPDHTTHNIGSYKPDDTKKIFNEIKKALTEKTEEDIKYRRTLEDLLYNLDFDNMPEVESTFNSMVDKTENSLAAITVFADENRALIELITQWQGEAESTMVSIKAQADANGGRIQLLTEWQSDISASVAEVQMQADENGASIQNLTQWQGEVDSDLGIMGNNIATISQRATRNSADIVLMTSSGLFSPNGDGTSEANAYVILSTFSDYNAKTGTYQLRSNISLSADAIDLSGYVTFSSLTDQGESVIHGGNILSETISTDKLTSDSGQLIFYRNIMFGNPSFADLAQVNNIYFRNGVSLYAANAGSRAVNFQNADIMWLNGYTVLHSGNYRDYVSDSTAVFG